MATIIENLKKILEARYGKDVRQAIHDSIENCYNDGKAGSIDLQARQDIETLETSIETVESIAKGKNQARVFSTTEAMENWLSDLSNKGVANVGDNLYIVAVDVPDWWISSVLEAPNESGMYYEIAQLETQKVDLTTIENAINSIDSKIGSTDISEIGDGTLTGGLDALNSNLQSKCDNVSQLPQYTYHFGSFDGMVSGDAFSSLKALRKTTKEPFKRGSLISIEKIKDSGAYDTFIIGSTDPDFFRGLCLSFYSEPYYFTYSNGVWTE